MLDPKDIDNWTVLLTAEVWPGQVKLARCSRNSDQISSMPTEMRWKPQMVVTVAAPRRMQGMSVILDDFQTNLDDFQTKFG